ncbi:alpha-hydroxy acid oxidase [Arthrobacter sp. ov118]|jgi:L-lactate dehydrogenase (cytochrome)|uniref:alpha-hydroxy acid oxidase n=1 Tax=Arthrobacter sp. ov118 TaxID=1761747 RepID=UPI0008E2EF48|nr:alpha-hydroxy acid oxidase [Arthrobacter sp. ov118]SFT53572.1 L-lactate dehydrogenase (cytochrome) [Arthrobacter sp. ov118]
MDDRQIPKWSELRELLQFRKLELDPVERRLAQAFTIADLRDGARKTTPRAVFNYTDGAAEEEITIARCRQAFRDIEFVPSVLRDVSSPDPTTEIFARQLAFPLVLAPTGYTRMMHNDGEKAVARVAARYNVPYTLSTVGTTTVEDLAEAAPDGNNWFQLYVAKDRAKTVELIDRVITSGYKVLMVTVDTQVGGSRVRELRDGLTIPPALSVKTFADMATHPSWWFDKLTTPPIEFASLRGFSGNSAEVADQIFDPGLTFEDIAWLRTVWPHKLLVKGIQSVADAERVVELGCDGVVLSNHGGRQLDRSPTVLRILPVVRERLGSDPVVLIDSGVMSGSDILAAVGLGADAAMVGRAYLYGLMAGGERGVSRALEILRGQYVRSMQLLGVKTTAGVTREHVSFVD